MCEKEQNADKQTIIRSNISVRCTENHSLRFFMQNNSNYTQWVQIQEKRGIYLLWRVKQLNPIKCKQHKVNDQVQRETVKRGILAFFSKIVALLWITNTLRIPSPIVEIRWSTLPCWWLRISFLLTDWSWLDRSALHTISNNNNHTYKASLSRHFSVLLQMTRQLVRLPTVIEMFVCLFELLLPGINMPTAFNQIYTLINQSNGEHVLYSISRKQATFFLLLIIHLFNYIAYKLKQKVTTKWDISFHCLKNEMNKVVLYAIRKCCWSFCLFITMLTNSNTISEQLQLFFLLIPAYKVIFT